MKAERRRPGQPGAGVAVQSAPWGVISPRAGTDPFLNLGAKPSIIRVGISGQSRGQSSLLRDARQEDAYGVGYGETNPRQGLDGLGLEVIIHAHVEH